jgi:hypothetical protein
LKQGFIKKRIERELFMGESDKFTPEAIVDIEILSDFYLNVAGATRHSGRSPRIQSLDPSASLRARSAIHPYLLTAFAEVNEDDFPFLLF